MPAIRQVSFDGVFTCSRCAARWSDWKNVARHLPLPSLPASALSPTFKCRASLISQPIKRSTNYISRCVSR